MKPGTLLLGKDDVIKEIWYKDCLMKVIEVTDRATVEKTMKKPFEKTWMYESCAGWFSGAREYIKDEILLVCVVNSLNEMMRGMTFRIPNDRRFFKRA